MTKEVSTKVEKNDILEDVKAVDRKVRAKIVYEKMSEIKDWAKEIATLKEKTQMLLEELGVESMDIKRLIDYATNSPEAQLTKNELEELREEVREEIDESKGKAKKKLADEPVTAFVGYSQDLNKEAYDQMFKIVKDTERKWDHKMNGGLTTGGTTWSSTAGAANVMYCANNNDGTTTYNVADGTSDLTFALK